MFPPIVNVRLWWAWNVARVAIIPSISLICEVVEGNNDKGNAESRDAPSSYCWHRYGREFIFGVCAMFNGSFS